MWWNLFLDFVPLGKSFTIKNNILRVRSVYSVWAGNIFVSLILARIHVLLGLIIFLGFSFLIFIDAHARPSLIWSSKSIQVRDRDKLEVLFDRKCLRSVELIPNSQRENLRIRVSFVHLKNCLCKKNINIYIGGNRRKSSYWYEQRLYRKTCLLSGDLFPFDPAIFAYAIASGVIDMSKQGLKKGLFNAV